METQKIKTEIVKDKAVNLKGIKGKEYVRGILLTLVLALVANQIVQLPFFSIMGIMIISIMLGMIWSGIMGTQPQANHGITFSSKYLLRAGIILMGLRLNLSQIFESGLTILLIDAIVIGFTLAVMIGLGKLLKVDLHLNTLIAVGTAICGAAAIVAVASVIKSKKEFTALAVACIAILGTIGALGYIFLYPYLHLDSYSYGVLVGSTLHELAHVIAAAVPGGEVSSETAIIVKLGRVALLIPVAIMIGFIFSKIGKGNVKEKSSIKNLPVPWFIFGFLAMSCLNTFILLPEGLVNGLLLLSVFLLSMAMAGLGLSIKFSDFKKVGFKPVLVGVIGFIALAALGPVLLLLIN
ncbi:putative integral membrane protein (TIGR00698 family) [Bacillus mesophilus]|uniref:Putative sulfate exporter family transporter n=1 Tax=Bacillus mesophilus TaxID=1808955 RepID=A0A6M0QAQ1_9BACI|nr:putative sulfate exporter family transporter [Bacillus mesophilus]MBM7662882.1 putative integral membrane protein (TIGR00698 family) [Bacillus mesophilus]NEY73471.1 putative sulfate exporter family transporter [Bacillus mesophilus]